ncbi:charged multivesicular body protein 7-like [Oppia nitens]|uniref:charged multivesicular body protein 7-like n=1 Tax=Oppia nitens TaxID=1686743 RepID=UPI0023DB171E|nr:charged multivesicular body protein 7-like [Oppia nitens]
MIMTSTTTTTKISMDSSAMPTTPIRNTSQLDRQSMRQSLATSPRSPSAVNDSYLYENDSIERPYLPECWTDTKRMTSLMAPFRAREANPEGWDLKMNFWINCITRWSLQTHSVVFNVADVTKAFERGGKRPDIQCLQLVFSHLKRNKSVVSLHDLKSNQYNSSSSKSWINWGFSTLVVKPISFGLSIVSSGDKDSDVCEVILPEISSDSKLVLNESLKVMSEEMNKYLTNLEDIDCIRFDNLFNKCKNKLNIDLETFSVIISQLEANNKLKIFVESGIKIVKIGKNSVISESDIGLIRLETAKELLESEIDKLESEIESIKDEARVCVRNKNREKAVILLRRKKRVEDKLGKKVIQLDNVDLLIDQLMNSSSHNMLVQAFQRANEALKLANNSQDDIENTMNDVEETIETVNEMVADVSRPLVGQPIDDDIEEELDDLLNELNASEQQSNSQLSKPTKIIDKTKDEELVNILNNLSVNDQSINESIEDTDKLPVSLAAN